MKLNTLISFNNRNGHFFSKKLKNFNFRILYLESGLYVFILLFKC